eukprot:1146041-Pelagomonas_calceolata.AAC.17
MDFAEPSSFSSMRSIAACGVKAGVENSRHQPGQAVDFGVAYGGLAGLPAYAYAPLRAMKIRQAPGVPAITQNQLQRTEWLIKNALLQFGPEQGPSQKWQYPGVWSAGFEQILSFKTTRMIMKNTCIH